MVMKNILVGIVRNVASFFRIFQNNPRIVFYGLSMLRQKGLKRFVTGIKNKINETKTLENTKIPESIDRCSFAPKISVIVPNYNHQKYLKKRLDSIYNQDYSNIEVILLDDNSTDESRTILEYYKEQHPDNTKTLFNATNSGSVFKQWSKGIENASGDLIWIAESDDYCELNFLSTLVDFFRDEAIMLAYAQYVFVNEEGQEFDFTFQNYVEALSKTKWKKSYVASAHDEVNTALGISNTIPNISGVVFRNPNDLKLLRNPAWLRMQICGDWILYLELLRGGRLAYSVETSSYFRFHQGSAGEKTYRTAAYYKEHEAVAKTIARYYRVEKKVLVRHRSNVENFFKQHVRDGSLDFDALYEPDIEKLLHIERIKTFMISIFAFSVGGGEIAPIRLANKLKDFGFTVVVHNYHYIATNPKIRKMLRQDIPVVTARTAAECIKVLDEFSPDIINTHHQAIQTMLLEAKGSCPRCFKNLTHISSMHGMYEAFDDDSLDRCLKPLCENAAYWTYVADKNVEPFKKRNLYSPMTFVKLPNGLEKPKFEKLSRQRFCIPEDAFILCLASRALPQKGWREAILAVDLARELTQKDIHLFLLGEGEMYDEFSKLQLDDHIHLMGMVENVCAYYDMSDMCFLPTSFAGESMPLSIIEALMVHTPVLATDIGEITSMLQSRLGLAGLTFPLCRGDIPIMTVAQGICHFASDHAAYARAVAAAAVCAAKFDIDTIALKFLSIVSEEPPAAWAA